MAKKKRNTLPEEAKDVEVVSSVNLEPVEEQATPETIEETIVEEPENIVPADEEPPHEESIVEVVTEDIQNGLVKVLVVNGSMGVVGLGSYEAGDTFIISKERAETLDQRFIKIV